MRSLLRALRFSVSGRTCHRRVVVSRMAWIVTAVCLLSNGVGQAFGQVGEASVGAEDLAEASEVPTVEFELLRPSRQLLADLQDHWIDWMTSVRSEDSAGAEAAADLILARAEELGLAGLPDLGLGAGALARSLASQDAFESAAIALESAERFDPGRPEVHAARAAVASESGSVFQAIRYRVSSLFRGLRASDVRRVLGADLAIWFLAVVQIGGGLFVCILMATHGAGLAQNVTRALEKNLPTWAALCLVVLLLVWPVALPGGIALLTIYWSVLVWGYSGRTERVVLAGFWILVLFSPLLVEMQIDRVGFGASPSFRVLERLEGERLPGDAFTDVAAMHSVLPEQPAVVQVTADLHRRLGQWGPAQVYYSKLLNDEPQNTEALTGLGVSYLQRGETSQAANAFRRATTDGSPQAAAYFHLSGLLSAKYDFSASRTALESAREIDRSAVDRWLESGNEVVAPNGGVARRAEIEGALVQRWRGDAVRWKEYLRQLAPALPVGIVFLGLALLLRLLQQRSGRPGVDTVGWASGVLEKVRRTLAPGLAEAEGARWILAFLSVLAFVALAAVPLAARVGFPLPWADPGAAATLTFFVILGLVVFFGIRAAVWWRA